MCSFFNQVKRARKSFAAKHGLPEPQDWEILHEIEEQFRTIRPTLLAETITAEGWHDRHWALVPHWSKEPKLKYSTFNARAESIKEKPTYRDAWKRSQRCLIPAVSYSEYPVIDGKKSRHNIKLAGGDELMIAGLWSDWHDGQGDQRDTFTMITTAPLDQIAWVHNRTPLLLSPSQWDQWLHGSPDECDELLVPNDVGELVVAQA